MGNNLRGVERVQVALVRCGKRQLRYRNIKLGVIHIGGFLIALLVFLGHWGRISDIYRPYAVLTGTSGSTGAGTLGITRSGPWTARGVDLVHPVIWRALEDVKGITFNCTA